LSTENFEASWKDYFTVVNTLLHGAVTFQTDEDRLFKVNYHHLKIFLEPKQPPKVVDEVDF
jgi:hypothetical protein